MNPAILHYCKFCEAKLDTAPEPSGKRYKEMAINEQSFKRVGWVVIALIVLFVLWKIGGLLWRPLSAINRAYQPFVEDTP